MQGHQLYKGNRNKTHTEEHSKLHSEVICWTNLHKERNVLLLGWSAHDHLVLTGFLGRLLFKILISLSTWKLGLPVFVFPSSDKKSVTSVISSATSTLRWNPGPAWLCELVELTKPHYDKFHMHAVYCLMKGYLLEELTKGIEVSTEIDSGSV